MNGTIKSLKAAIKSRRNFKTDITAEQMQRLKICAQCPFNSNNKEQKSIKDRFYILFNNILNLFWGIVVDDDSTCVKCGCQLIHKTTQEDEDLKCPLKKW